MSLADELVDLLRPLAQDGNPYATLSIFRIQISENPDETAEQILTEVRTLAKYVVALWKKMEPWLRAAGLWQEVAEEPE